MCHIRDQYFDHGFSIRGDRSSEGDHSVSDTPVRTRFFLTLLAAIFLTAGLARTEGKEPPHAVNIILDSDMTNDADDVGDHAVLWGLADCGEAKVLALIMSSPNDYSAATAEVLARHFRHGEVPIGAYQGSTPSDYSAVTSAYTKELAEEFGFSGKTRAKYPDAVTVYREALASAPDHSVTIVAGGFYEPLRALLESRPDRFSALDGAQLVAGKVARLVSAAGVFPDSGKQSEHNFAMDPDGASFVFAHWPTEIVSFGTEAGWDVVTGPKASANPTHDPVKRAYDLYCQNGQYCAAVTPAWTQIAILYAVRGGLGPLFSMAGTNGSTVVSDSKQPVPGRNVWTQTPNDHHSYVEKATSAAALAKILDPLLQHAPASCDEVQETR